MGGSQYIEVVPVAHALSMPRSQECEHGTQVCVRYGFTTTLSTA
jgi:hypothetical protein